MIFKQAQIDRYFKKPDLGLRCFVVYGQNEGLVAENVRSLMKTVVKDVYDPFSTVYLQSGEVLSDISILFSEFSSQSLMGGRRVIYLKDADNNLTKHLKALLEIKTDTLLVISSASLNKKSSLVALAEGSEECVAIACYEDRDEDIFATARGVLVEKGFMLKNDALQLLCSRLSSDRKTTLNELNKLMIYMGDKKDISFEDILSVISDQSNSSLDDVIYNVASGFSEKAQKAFEKLINDGTEPVSIVRSVSNHFQRLVLCRGYLEEGESIDKVLYKLTPRVMFFRETSFKKQVSIWGREKLFSVIELLYKCEKDCKTTNMPAKDIVAYTLLQVASAAAKLSRV